jgi:hypothetical protein
LEKTLGPAHPEVAFLLGSYTVLLRSQGRDIAAEAMEKRAENILQQLRKDVVHEDNSNSDEFVDATALE